MRKYLFLVLGSLLASCGQGEEVTLLAPEIILSPSLAESIDQVDFWIYNIMDKENKPLTCERLMLTDAEAVDPNDKLFKVAYYNTMVFYQDRESKKEYKNIPAASNYIIYARGYEVSDSDKQKFLRAHGCLPNIAINRDEVTSITIDLTAASAK